MMPLSPFENGKLYIFLLFLLLVWVSSSCFSSLLSLQKIWVCIPALPPRCKRGKSEGVVICNVWCNSVWQWDWAQNKPRCPPGLVWWSHHVVSSSVCRCRVTTAGLSSRRRQDGMLAMLNVNKDFFSVCIVDLKCKVKCILQWKVQYNLHWYYCISIVSFCECCICVFVCVSFARWMHLAICFDLHWSSCSDLERLLWSYALGMKISTKKPASLTWKVAS